ncbi:MAG: SPOR domain-containing protein [Rikenellaceae bacterium]
MMSRECIFGKKQWLIIAVVCAWVTVVSAQSGGVRARIAGLADNNRYMELLSREDSLAHREDSIMVIVKDNRAKLRAATAEEQKSLAVEIRTLEDGLFGLRAAKSGVVSEINNIEQRWVIENLKTQGATRNTTQVVASGEGDEARSISKSRVAQTTLQSVDLENLEKAERLTSNAKHTAATYINNYREMARQSEEYRQVERKSAADSILVAFNHTDSINVVLAKRLAKDWNFIVDNKSFAYAMLMEKAAANDAFTREEELLQRASAEIAKYEDKTDAVELLDYHMRQMSSVEYEIIVAQKLSLGRVVDSLVRVRDSLKVVEFNYPQLVIHERLFLDFEDIKFSTTPQYNAKNPIPDGVVYDRGTIYRINVGAFKARQAVSLFRGAYPISILKDEDGMFVYYLGGYKSLAEAQEAREAMLKKGFRRPEVVEWRDGVMRNLTKDPRPEATSFRIELDGVGQLPEETATIIKGSPYELSRVGAKRFVVGVIDNRNSADSLAGAIINVAPASLSVIVIDVE